MNSLTIDQAFQIALGHHQAGQFAQAEGIYRQVLAQVPNHPDALNMLGILAFQTGHTAPAIELIGRAIAVNPAAAAYHSNLGEVYRNSGQTEAAIASFRRAIELKPDSAEVHSNLGNALKQQGRLDESIDAYRRAIALRPDLAEAHSNLGDALKPKGLLDEAIDACQTAIQLRPDYAEAYINLGNALNDQGRFDEAIASCHRAIALRPGSAEAHHILGNALQHERRLDEAISAYHRAIELRPELAEAHASLGDALRDQGRLNAAMAAYHRAIELRPDLAEAHGNIGVIFHEMGLPDEAITACRRALQLKPDSAETYNVLGNALKDRGRLDEVLACFRKAVELKPDYAHAACNVVCTLPYHPDYDARAILTEQRQWASQFAEPLAAQIRPHTNDRAPDRTLRIGFLSPNFRANPVGWLLPPLFSHHDRRQTEFVCYSDAPRADGVTERFRALADQWYETVDMSDPQLADRIRADRIDILVDTTMHTAHNRLLVFARKPAPIQVAMLGLPISTGLATIDYRLTDRFLDPPGSTDDDYTEQSIRLPHGFWCFQPPDEAPPVGELPAYRNGYVTFGCLNRLLKVSPPALQVWIEVLHSLPTARLVIQSQPGSHLDEVRTRLEAGGIALDRVDFARMVSLTEYFRQYHKLDLSLDPFPHNGHTSTLDSLWQGVPIITLAGRTVSGRAGVSLLSNIGLPELIAETPQQYVDIAVRWARDLPGLAALRAGLRQRMQDSPLLDGAQFTADVEAAFRRMWQRWCGQ